MITNEIIVVGGGASGMVAAIAAASRGYKVRILERLLKVGKKILATGNGKCNLTNLQQHKNDYRGRESWFSKEVLQRFSVEDALHFFEELGLVWKEKDGYVYPWSEQATAVLTVLELKLQSLGVVMDCGKAVESIQQTRKGFLIKTAEETYQTKVCILACGGRAQPKLGSDGSGYQLAHALGHSVYPAIPALTALHTSHLAKKEWGGVRVYGSVACLLNGKEIAKEEGELQLTNYGISGVPVFQISRYATEALYQKEKVQVQMDFFPKESQEMLQIQLKQLAKSCPYKNIRELLEGIFPKKLVPVFLAETGIKNTLRSFELREKEYKKLSAIIKSFMLSITDCNGFDQCQVCAGGVDVREVDPISLESQLVPNLYITGELLDVDGTCGGYNLQWAWATGFLAGNHIAFPQHR